MSNTSTRKPAEAVAYLRVASTSQGDHPNALNDQRERCQQYARNRGLTITCVYADVGVSGNSPRRPALDRMLRKLSYGRIGYLIAADNTRLARSPILRLAFELELGRYGAAHITSPSPLPIDTMLRHMYFTTGVDK